MIKQEKKYRITSFDSIEKKLKKLKARKIHKIISTHYYGEHEGNDVEKFVEYTDRVELHVLKESNGKFKMIEHKKITDKNAGFSWLKEKSYKTANIVEMAYSEYAYKDGTVGLYIIDDFFHSVILCYPLDQHSAIEEEFALENAEVIMLPYNKYLKQLGKLQSMKL